MPDTFEILKFGRFTLDPRRRELRADGKLVPVEGKKFDLLSFLVARRDASVSRDEILANVWGGRAVSDGSVTVAVHELRKALAKAGGTSAMILTLPNQRYRFVGDAAGETAAEVVPEPEPRQDAAADNVPATPVADSPAALVPAARAVLPARWMAGAALAVLVLAASAVAVLRQSPPPGLATQRFSIVVMPFRNLSDDRTQDYLADAVTDDLAADLAHIPGSTVIARESAVAAASRTPQEIGSTLHVRYIVRGSLLPEGPSLHITALLEDTQTGAQLWTDSFDRIAGGNSATREDIVRRIASALHVQLDQLESTRSLHDRPHDPDALDHYFRARAMLDSAATIASLAQAQAELERAIAKQPDFADAKAELAWTLLRKATTMDDPDEDADYSRAKELIAQALAASPRNGLALAARAKERQTDGHCDEARQYAAHAVAIDASSLPARSVLARCAQIELHLDDAAAQYETMLKLNPDGMDSGLRYIALGYIDVIEGKYQAAIDPLNHAAAAAEGDIDPYAGMDPEEQARLMLIAAYQLSGRTEEAAATYRDYATTWPGRTVWRVSTYFPKAWLGLPGMQRILGALEHAGMQHFAPEPAQASPDKTLCADGDFAPTPSSLPDAGVVLDTDDVRSWRTASPPPVVIDLGRGAAVMDGAIWRSPGADTEPSSAFALRTAREAAKGDAGRPIIVLSDGSTGCSAWRASVALLSAGYRHTGWYRGGEEAWVAKGQTATDRRGK